MRNGSMDALRTRVGRVLRMVATMVVVTVLAVPVAAWASHQFDDVPDSNIFHADIAWMKANGVTAGCGGNDFCPDDNVTREQMSAFMRRLETKGVFLTADGKAADAEKLDGLDSSAFLGATDKAVDADELDGLDSTDFLPRFAVFSYNLSTFSTLNHRGLSSATRTGVGAYTLVWDESIANCAWVGTAGARNGATSSVEHTVSIHGGAGAGEFTMNVRTFDDNSADDTSFSVAIHC